MIPPPAPPTLSHSPLFVCCPSNGQLLIGNCWNNFMSQFSTSCLFRTSLSSYNRVHSVLAVQDMFGKYMNMRWYICIQDSHADALLSFTEDSYLKQRWGLSTSNHTFLLFFVCLPLPLTPRPSLSAWLSVHKLFSPKCAVCKVDSCHSWFMKRFSGTVTLGYCWARSLRGRRRREGQTWGKDEWRACVRSGALTSPRLEVKLYLSYLGKRQPKKKKLKCKE